MSKMKVMQQQAKEVEEEISEDDDSENAQETSRKKNICFVCQKQVERLPRHLKTHKDVVKGDLTEIKLKKYQANHEYNLNVIREGEGADKLILANNKKSAKIKPSSGRCPDKTYKLKSIGRKFFGKQCTVPYRIKANPMGVDTYWLNLSGKIYQHITNRQDINCPGKVR
jgi:hypothetical protein